MQLCKCLSVLCSALDHLLTLCLHSRKSAITAESIQNYNELLNTAKAGFKDHLERMDEKLELIIGQNIDGSELDTSEVRRIKEECLSTGKCLQIYAQLSEHISQVQITAQRSATTGVAGDLSSIPERITNEGLQGCKESLACMAEQLASHEK